MGISPTRAKMVRVTLDMARMSTVTGLRKPTSDTDAVPLSTLRETVASAAEDASTGDYDPGDLTLIFNNQLI